VLSLYDDDDDDDNEATKAVVGQCIQWRKLPSPSRQTSPPLPDSAPSSLSEDQRGWKTLSSWLHGKRKMKVVAFGGISITP